MSASSLLPVPALLGALLGGPLLLIAAEAKGEKKVEITLPESRRAGPLVPSVTPPFVVNVGPAGEVVTPTGPALRTEPEVAALVKRAAADARPKKKGDRIRVPVVVRADGKAPSGRVLFVLWAAARGGFTNLQARARRPGGGEGMLPLLVAGARPAEARAVVVRVGPKGPRFAVVADKREVAVPRPADLPAALARLREGGDAVYLEVGGALPWAEVIRALDACLEAKFEQVVLVAAAREA